MKAVLVTDHAVLRHFVAAGYIHNITTYKMIPVSMDRMEQRGRSVVSNQLSKS